jgi:hypothetical protein
MCSKKWSDSLLDQAQVYKMPLKVVGPKAAHLEELWPSPVRPAGNTQ